MEDDNCLDLTLGMSLPSGLHCTSSKGRNSSSSDIRTEDSDRGSKLIDDFKNFLDGGTQKPDHGVGNQRSDPAKPEENLFYDLSETAINRSSEVEEERRAEAGSKRKNLFNDVNHQKKHERDDKTRTSHISITTDEGSTAENEDVADSEADGSTSRLVQHHDDGSKKRSGSIGFDEVPKEVRGHGISDSSAADSQGQRRFTMSSGKEFKMGNVPYGVTFPGQSINILNMPYPLPGKDSNSSPIAGPVTSSYAFPGMIPVMTGANSERAVTQPVIPANLPLMYGYSPVQMPTLNSATRPVIAHQTSEVAKGEGKHENEEGSSSHREDGVKESSTLGPSRSNQIQPRTDRFPSEYPAIRPGIAAELKFGGSGSAPNLPWVSTTGAGPNGKTISGVTYRYSATQIRIVCACHGSHLSPEEFVHHAVEEQPTPNSGSGLASIPSSNPAASAQS